MRNRLQVALTFIAVLSSACGKERAPILELTGPTMGTRYSIKVPANEPVPDGDLLQRQVDDMAAGGAGRAENEQLHGEGTFRGWGAWTGVRPPRRTACRRAARQRAEPDDCPLLRS